MSDNIKPKDFNYNIQNDEKLQQLKQLALKHIYQHQSNQSEEKNKKHLKEETYTQDAHLMRLLIARNYIVQNAFTMWEKWFIWKLKHQSEDIIESDQIEELKTGKAYWYHHNKLQQPCMFIRLDKHDPKVSSVAQVSKLFIFLLEVGLFKMKQNKAQKIVVVNDMQLISWRNIDIRLFELIQMMQDNYAEMLDMVYIVHPPFFFKHLYRLVERFLSERTKSKIRIISDPAELLQYFDKECLPIKYGGLGFDEYVYDQGYYADYQRHQQEMFDLQDRHSFHSCVSQESFQTAISQQNGINNKFENHYYESFNSVPEFKIQKQQQKEEIISIQRNFKNDLHYNEACAYSHKENEELTNIYHQNVILLSNSNKDSCTCGFNNCNIF